MCWNTGVSAGAFWQHQRTSVIIEPPLLSWNITENSEIPVNDALSSPKDWKSLGEWVLGPFFLEIPPLGDLVYICPWNCCTLVSNHRHSPIPCWSSIDAVICGLQQKVCWPAQGVCIKSALQGLVAFGQLFQKALGLHPKLRVLFVGCSARWKGSTQPWAVWDPWEGGSSQQCCKWGHQCFICCNRWQSWGAADGLPWLGHTLCSPGA